MLNCTQACMLRRVLICKHRTGRAAAPMARTSPLSTRVSSARQLSRQLPANCPLSASLHSPGAQAG